jgi:hypothetical protein
MESNGLCMGVRGLLRGWLMKACPRIKPFLVPFSGLRQSLHHWLRKRLDQDKHQV